MRFFKGFYAIDWDFLRLFHEFGGFQTIFKDFFEYVEIIWKPFGELVLHEIIFPRFIMKMRRSQLQPTVSSSCSSFIF